MRERLVRATVVLLGVLGMIVLWEGAARAQLPEPAGGAVEEVCNALGGCATCNADLGQCQSDLGTCNGNLSTCESDLAACQACGDGNLDSGEPCDVGQLGGATCASATGGASPFGELRCGPGCTFDTSGCTVRFTDNGDGTVTDHQTGLMWEQKTTTAGVHNVNDSYSWSSCFGCTAPDGTAFTTFLAALNGGVTGVGNCSSGNGSTVSGGFLGHCDWRLPQIDELRSIVDCSQGAPCVNTVFGPTASSNYWSATSHASLPDFAGFVGFVNGTVSFVNKVDFFRVRAVRGGSE